MRKVEKLTLILLVATITCLMQITYPLNIKVYLCLTLSGWSFLIIYTFLFNNNSPFCWLIGWLTITAIFHTY